MQTHDVVAIGMIHPEFMNNPEVFELFRREASILHNLTLSDRSYFVFSVDPDIRRTCSRSNSSTAVADDAARFRPLRSPR